MPVDLTNNDISTRYALQEDFDNGFVGRDRQVVIQTDDPKGYRPVIMDGATQGGKNKVALMDDIEDIYNRYNNYGILPEDATQKTYSTVQQLQSTTDNLSDYAGAQGQLVYNTDTKHLHLMDGSTVGGIQVANYSEVPIIATEEEAEAGTDNTKMMTPLRTKQLIEVSSIDANEIKQIVLNAFFPVGSIYMDATGSINPNTQFGGTWAKIENRFLLASGTRGVGNTGGEENVTLNINQIPSHTHYANSFNSTGTLQLDGTAGFSSATGAFSKSYSLKKNYEASGSSIEKLATLNTKNSTSGEMSWQGGNGSHNNMPPYQVVAIWRRTA